MVIVTRRGSIPDHIIQNLQGHGSPSQKSHQQNCQYCISWWSEISADFFYNSFFLDIYFVCQFLNTNQSIPNHFNVVPLDLVLPTSTVFGIHMDWLWTLDSQRWGQRTWNVAFPCPRDVTTRATQRAIVGRCGCGLEVVKIAILAKPWNHSSLRALSRYRIWGA